MPIGVSSKACNYTCIRVIGIIYRFRHCLLAVKCISNINLHLFTFTSNHVIKQEGNSYI